MMVDRLLSGLLWGLVFGLILGLFWGLVWNVVVRHTLGSEPLGWNVFYGLVFGLGLGLRNGGWFVLLQKVAHRRLARTGNLPPRLYDFLEWAIERQIFRRVGGGVRFCHNLIQQHLANISEGAA